MKTVDRALIVTFIIVAVVSAYSIDRRRQAMEALTEANILLIEAIVNASTGRRT